MKRYGKGIYTTIYPDMAPIMEQRILEREEMQGKSKKRKGRNASQGRWMSAVRMLGSVISGGPALVHHCIGETGSHNKIKVGHEFIIPLTELEHKALHKGDTFGYESRKDFEKAAFHKISFALHDHPDLPAQHIIDAIMDYHL
jgi:hypothetical protein